MRLTNIRFARVRSLPTFRVAFNVATDSRTWAMLSQRTGIKAASCY
jgi:hypothetical protein